MNSLETPIAGCSAASVDCSAANQRSCATCMARVLAICGDLAPDELSQVERLLTRVKLEPGDTLYYEGDPGDFIYTINEGMMKLYKLMADGRRQVTGFHFMGDFLGLSSENGYGCSAEAVTTVHLCRFPVHRLEQMTETYPSIEKRLFSRLCAELDRAQDQLLVVGRKTALERISSFLIAISNKAVGSKDSQGRLSLKMTRNDIADHLGLTTETVSRSFTQLRKSGAISSERDGRIVILDHDRLEDLSNGV